jgi:hypothetical protein
MTRTGSGLASLPLLYPDAVQMDLIPRFEFGGGRIANAPDIRPDQAPFTNFNTTYDVVANLTKVMGPHAVKMGFYYQKSLKDQSAFASHNGYYQFNNSTSNPFDAQHPFANARSGSTTTSPRRPRSRPAWQWNYSGLRTTGRPRTA